MLRFVDGISLGGPGGPGGQSEHITPLERGVNADQGWLGYTYRLSDMPEDTAVRGWIAWRYLGETNAGYAVETYHHGGGTGQFTSVQTVRREGDQLHLVTSHMGGDRCNGGVAAAAVAGGVVSVAVNVTPFELLALALGEQDVFHPVYEGITSCAICCVGTVTFVDDDLAWVSLDPPEEGFADPDVDSAQACLDGLLRDTWRSLTRSDLEQFGKAFVERCRHSD